MYTVADFADKLGLRKKDARYVGSCPLCGGKDRLHVEQGSDGWAKFGCRGCIDYGQDLDGAHSRAILQIVGGKAPYAGDSRPPRTAARHVCGTYCVSYDRVDGKGKVKQHRRPCDGPECTYPGCEGKDTKHLWVYPGGARPRTHVALYKEADGPVVVAEGEKAARAIEAAGLRACSWHGGTGGVVLAEFARLEGMDVVLWPDADDAGYAAMHQVVMKVSRAGAASIRMVDVSELPAKADAADVDAAMVQTMVAAAAVVDIPEDVATAPPPDVPAVEPTSAGDGEWSDWACTPVADAVRLLRKHDDKVLVVLDRKTGDAELRIDNGFGIWRHDSGQISYLMMDTARDWEGRAFGNAKGDRALDARKWALRTATPAGVRDTLAEIARALVTLDKHEQRPLRLTVCYTDELDIDGNVLGAANGVINLSSGTLLSREEARAAKVTKMLPDDYVKGAEHWAMATLFGALPELEADWLLNAMAFALNGYCHETLYLIYGEGNAGKSTLLEALFFSVGEDYAMQAQAGAFTAPQFASQDKPEPAKFMFAGGVRFVCCDEPQLGRGSTLDWAMLKGLTGGRTGTGRQMRKDPVPLRYTATLFMFLNALPRIPTTNDGGAVERRARTLPVAAIPEDRRDTRLKYVWEQDPTARQAFVAELVRRAATQKLPPADTPTVADARQKLKAKSTGVVRLWLQTAVVREEGAKLLTKDLHNAAIEALGEGALGKEWDSNRLTRETSDIHDMTQTVPMSVGGVKGSGWKGWRLADPAADIEEAPPCCPHTGPSDHDEYGECVYRDCDCLGMDAGAPSPSTAPCTDGDCTEPRIGGSSSPYRLLCPEHGRAKALADGSDDPANEIAEAIAEAREQRGAGAAAMIPRSFEDVEAFMASAAEADGIERYGAPAWAVLQNVMRPSTDEDFVLAAELRIVLEDGIAAVTTEGAIVLTTGAHLHVDGDQVVVISAGRFCGWCVAPLPVEQLPMGVEQARPASDAPGRKRRRRTKGG